MKRRTILQYSILVFFALTAFVIGSALLVRNNLNKVSELHLNQYLSVVKLDYQNQLTPNQIVAKYISLSENLRITIIASDGTVLADTLADVTENHGNRPEVLEPGTVFIRYSDTLGKRMLYLANQMSNGVFVRVAIPESSLLPFLNDFVGFSILVSAVIITIAIVLIVGLVNLNIRPLKAIEMSLSSIASGGYAETLPLEKDDEVNRIVSRLNEINRLLADNLQTLSLEKQKNDFLLNQMSQGLAVLNQKGEMILLNRFLKELFHLEKTFVIHQHYLYVFRIQSLQQTIEKVYQDHEFATSFFEWERKYYSITAHYLDSAWDQLPCVLLLVNDVTQIKDVEITKRDFFANASHELKSPLTSIIGASELITAGFTKTMEDAKDLATRILQEAQRMNRLVLDMLSLSKYENIIIHRGTQMVDLVSVVEDVKHRLIMVAHEKQISIDTKLASVVLQGDYEHLYELIQNVVENSIKYGKVGGFVRVTIEKDQQSAKIEVEDNGIGIPKAEHNRVFERFYRIDKSRSQKVSGTGLGLSIVKHIVMLYQGQIHLVSEPNIGTKITIILPLHP